MRVVVKKVLELDKDAVKRLVRRAKDAGHNHDGMTASGKLIKRLLEAKVEEEVARAQED